MSPAPALLYSRAGCPYCDAQRTALAARAVSWREIDVAARPEVIPELLKLTGGRRIVPVIVDEHGIRVAPDGGTTF